MYNVEVSNNNPQTVLVVDNLEEGRRLLGAWLKMRGYRVLEAEGGEEAVETARRELPDLILMDIKMPGLDGIGAAQLIRGDLGLRDVAIVAHSADNTEYNRAKALEAGFNDYLVKPVLPEELEGMLDRLLPSKKEYIVH
jgi:CheY-like chemotaxis protein